MVQDEITLRVGIFEEMKVAQRQNPEHHVRDRKRVQPGRRSQEDEGRKQKPMEGLLLMEI